MRKRSCVMFEPVLLVAVRRMLIVPNCALLFGSFVRSHARFGCCDDGGEGASRASPTVVFWLSGREESSGLGALRVDRRQPYIAPSVETKMKCQRFSCG